MILARKYSPLGINHFNNNDKLINIIKGIINIDKLSFVLYGPSCYGKTTLVGIILNEYYKDIPQSERIMRVNILKDNGISFCRNEMKMFCTRRYVPSMKKNTIIIEDIGFISEQSQNMIKEYIDLYRDRVNFIITSTNNNKIVCGIKSKIPIFKLNPPSTLYISNLLDNVTVGEHINISSDNKSHLLTFVNDNIRLLFSYLEILSVLGEEITYSMLEDLCNDIPNSIMKTYYDKCCMGDINSSIQDIYSLKDRGYCNMDIITELLKYIRYHCDTDDKTKYKIIDLITTFMGIFCDKHEEDLELAVFTNKMIKLLSSNYGNISDSI